MAGASIDAAVAAIQTIGQGRAALGEAARLLRQAYGYLDDVPSVGSARDSARSLLDGSNTYASRVYNALPDDDASQGVQLDATTRRQVQAALQQADQNLRMVEQAANQTYFDFAAGLRVAAQAVGQTAGTIAGATASAVGEGAGSLLGGVLSGLGLGWTVVLVIVALTVLFPGLPLKLLRKVVP